MRGQTKAGFGTLGRKAREKLSNDNDIKIIIQGKNSQTGIGKTTLAVQLCRFIDSTDSRWSAKEKAYVEPERYLSDFLDVEQQSALLLDEIGAGADSRRSMSKENVDLSQGWQMLRARNVATVATLPSTSTLDKRLLELADYWILVKSRGLAQPYKIRVNDFNGTVARSPLAGEEHIRFPDLPNNDPDKKYLDSIKDDKVERLGSHAEKLKQAEHQKIVERECEEAMRERRNEILADLYHETDLTYEQIGELPTVDLGRDTVWRIVNE